MARWEPNARERLEEAALALYEERGFDATTVSEIAARAGLTERTFFRHFADKREVIFGGADRFKSLLVEGVVAAPKDATPLAAVVSAIDRLASFWDPRRAVSIARNTIVSSHPELRERELIKLADTASAIAETLRQRGVKDPTATLAAEAGIAILKLAFQRWVDDEKARSFSLHLREAHRAMQKLD